MTKRITAFVIIAMLFLSAAARIAYAAEPADKTNEGMMTIVASGSHISTGESSGGFLFLFASGIIRHASKGNILLLFSKAELSAEVDGDIYLLFSELKLGEGVAFGGTIHTLSSKLTLAGAHEQPLFVEQLASILNIFQTSTETVAGLVIDDTIENIGMYFSLLMMLLCYLAYAIKKAFVVQGSLLIYHEPLELMRNGIVFYFVFLVISILFTATLFLVPLTIAGFLIFGLFFVFGEAALAAVVGKTIMDSIGLKLSSLACMIIGLLILESIRNIPYINWGFSYLFLPLLCCGISITSVINGFIKKRFYPDLFYDEARSTSFTAIRKMVVKS